MSKYYFSITQWPSGLGLDFGDESGGYSFVGPHGGGVAEPLNVSPLLRLRLRS